MSRPPSVPALPIGNSSELLAQIRLGADASLDAILLWTPYGWHRSFVVIDRGENAFPKNEITRQLVSTPPAEDSRVGMLAYPRPDPCNE